VGTGGTYGEVREVDDGPGGPRGAAGDGEDEEPGEEEEQDVGGPDARVHEPLGVLVDVHRRRRLHVVGLPSPPHLLLSQASGRSTAARRISGLSRRGRARGRVRDREEAWRAVPVPVADAGARLAAEGDAVVRKWFAGCVRFGWVLACDTATASV